MSASVLSHLAVNLDTTVAGQIRVRVKSKKPEFSKWYRVHTPLRVILKEALDSEPLKPLQLSASNTVVTRWDPVYGLIQVDRVPD